MIGLFPLTGALVIFLLAVVFRTAANESAFIGPLCTAAANGTADWTFDAWIIVPVAASALLYGGGILALWSRPGIGRGPKPGQIAAFCAGWLALAGALVSPLHQLGTKLFTAHMIEHELVMAVAAPLLVIARPAAVFLWALPRETRHAVGRAMRSRPAIAAWGALTLPATATILHGVAIWGWHVPPLFDDALANVTLHRLQHVSFIVTALIFWWAVLRRCNAGSACLHVFITLMHTSLLGAILTLAPRVHYAAQTVNAPRWGLSALEDQQLAGLVMWVPAGLIYAGAALALAALWISRSGARAQWRRSGDAFS